MNKKLDCVEMKREGAERLQKKLAGLSIKEELQFWQERNKVLLGGKKRSGKGKKRTTKA